MTWKFGERLGSQRRPFAVVPGGITELEVIYSTEYLRFDGILR